MNMFYKPDNSYYLTRKYPDVSSKEPRTVLLSSRTIQIRLKSKAFSEASATSAQFSLFSPLLENKVIRR